MRALILLCLLLLSGFHGAAQVVGAFRVVKAQGEIDTAGLRDKLPRKPLSTWWGHVEQMPMFEGGVEGIFCFLYRNNRFTIPPASYPTGRVFIAFVVDTAGQVQDVKLLNGLHPELDAKALRLVRLLSGRFTPGYNNKRPVAVPLTLPIHFPAVVPDRKQLRRCF